MFRRGCKTWASHLLGFLGRFDAMGLAHACRLHSLTRTIQVQAKAAKHVFSFTAEPRVMYVRVRLVNT